MFGITNKTLSGFSFITKLGKFSFEFTAGIVEEVTFNVTGAAAANAAEIPSNMNVKLISKDQFITGTSAVVSSKVMQTKLLDVIVGATPNLLI